MTIPRRTIAKGAAWGVPVVLVGAAAPESTASPPPPPEFEQDLGAACKYPGQSTGYHWGYRLPFKVMSTVGGILEVIAATVPGGTAVVIEGGPYILAPGVETEIVVVLGSTNSANGTGTLSYNFSGLVGTTTVEFDNFPPCKE